LTPEDEARANLYALIGRLFYDAPDSMLLAEICRDATESPASAGEMGDAWRALRAAAKIAYPALLKQEYDALFVGVGKAQVTPYTSNYVKSTAPDRHLVRLREQLGQWGLVRRSAASEVEDHVSGLCDVMRHLILEGHAEGDQRSFFKEFVHPGVTPFLDAVNAAAAVVFYRLVADLARAFLEIERVAFEMEEV
jgi:TorA maturation chaperone TorD